MLEEGYAAVSTRRVAKHVGLTSALVHYYFPTTDDLLVAVYRRAVDKTMERLRQALAAERPLRALWALNADADCTALALEFMAMSNHRKIIRAEIAHSADLFRNMHAEGLAKILPPARSGALSPLGLTVFIASISRLLVMETMLGITLGHDEAEAAVAAWLDEIEAAATPAHTEAA
jgi:AcrR family transcriptional regulator